MMSRKFSIRIYEEFLIDGEKITSWKNSQRSSPTDPARQNNENLKNFRGASPPHTLKNKPKNLANKLKILKNLSL